MLACADDHADLAVIGGTGLYSMFDGARSVVVETPYGPPSSDITLYDDGNCAVAFLARHGRRHEFPAHRVPYRANLWALAALGVTRVLAPCAVGSLRADVGPGAFAVPDQLLDRTHGRDATFYDNATIHVPFAEPYCATLRHATVAALSRADMFHYDGGTMVVVPGPRFGTRAEAEWHRRAGADFVNMTGLPEAALARELGLCYCAIAVVTDWDAGLDIGESVTQTSVMQRFADSLAGVQQILMDLVSEPYGARDCECTTVLDGMDIPDLGLRGQPTEAHDGQFL